MKARRLIQQLSDILDMMGADNMDVIIDVSGPFFSNFEVGVQSVGNGIDWHSGKIVLFPQETLTTFSAYRAAKEAKKGR